MYKGSAAASTPDNCAAGACGTGARRRQGALCSATGGRAGRRCRPFVPHGAAGAGATILGGRGQAARRSLDIAALRPPRMAPRNYYSLSTVSEIGLLERNRGTYHGVMVGAGFASLYSSTVALRLGAMRKPFFVDPGTAPLGLDTGLIGWGGVMSSSYRRLVERMDAAVGSGALGRRIGRGRLTPADFGVGGSGGGAADLTDALAAGSLDVQRRCLDPAASRRGRSIKKYSEMLGGRAGVAPARKPEFAVAPYFCAPDAESEWFEVNVKLFKAAAKRERGAYAVLCMDGEPDGWKGMAEKAADAYPGAGGFLVWAAGFDDARAPELHLRQYGEMLSAVKEAQKPVVVLHAGYYALLLSARLGIAGYARGIGGAAGELGGGGAAGGAPQRYYLRWIHAAAMPESAAAALAASPKIRCGCRACKDAMKRGGGRGRGGGERYRRMIQAMGRGPLKEHFMHAHKGEIEYAKRGGRGAGDPVMGRLTAADVSRISGAGVPTRHMGRWRAALP